MASLLKFAAAALLVASARAGKAGAAYNEISLVEALCGENSAISWSYNWGSSSYGNLPSGIEFVPMLWGTTGTYLENWNSTVQASLDDGSSYIMGFNEPDVSSQADLTPAEAASYYLEYITPYSDKATLVSPAVTSSTTSGEGLSWFESFIGDCSDCGISVLAVHWYGNSVAELESFITEAISTAANYGISEVWLTEFALSTDEGGISDLSTAAAFVQEAAAWLNKQSALTRYSYFYVANGYLLTNGVANSVGEAYTSAAGSSSSSSSSPVTKSAASTTSSTSVYVAPAMTSSSTTSTSVYVAPTSVSVEVAPVATTTSTSWTTTITIKSTVTVAGTACPTTTPASCLLASATATPSGFVTSAL